MAKIEWESIPRDDKCTQTVVGTYCDFVNIGGGYYDWQCFPSLQYVETPLTQIPSYSVFRVIDGTEELIMSIAAKNIIGSSNSIGFSSENWVDGLVNLYELYTNTSDIVIDSKKMFVMDFEAPYHLQGKKVEYKVVTKYSKANDCGSNATYTSIISLDANGDKYVDFIPKEEYDKLFGKYYGWLVPVTSLLLN